MRHKVYIHVWADGVRKVLDGGKPEPLVLVRAEPDLHTIYRVAEVDIAGPSRMVFCPAASERLPGFDGRVVCWLECMLGDVRVQPHIGARTVPYADFLHQLSRGELKVPLFRASAKPTVKGKGKTTIDTAARRATGGKSFRLA